VARPPRSLKPPFAHAPDTVVVSGPIKPQRPCRNAYRGAGPVANHANKNLSWAAGGSALAGRKGSEFSKPWRLLEQNTRTGRSQARVG